MARENEVKLIGIVDNIKKDSKNRLCEIQMTVVRRNGRVDNPTVLILPDYYDMVKNIKEKDYVMIKGFFATMNKEEKYECPNCHKIIKNVSTVSSIIAIYAIKLQGVYSLEDFKEVSNCVTLLGPLCRNVKLKELPSGAKNAQYQMAIARKIRVSLKGDNTTDFPFISSLDGQAEEDYKRMEEGSQCYINGGVQTRAITKSLVCKCGERINVKQNIMEVCPYSVEYLYNCKFDED